MAMIPSRFLLSLCLLTSAALAQDTPPIPPTPVPDAPTPTPIAPKDPRQTDTPGAKTPTGAVPDATPTPTGTPAPKTVAELTKDHDKTEGLFTLYRRVEKNKQKMLAEVRESQIGPLFLMQATFASGNSTQAAAGRPARDLVWRFQRTPDDRLILSSPNLWYRSSDPNLKAAVDRDFPDAYLAVFPILARDKARGTLLIDFAELFDPGVTGINTAFQAEGVLRALLPSYSLDANLSFVEAVKNFPTNLVIESNLHFKRQSAGSLGGGATTQADPRSLPVKVTYNVYPLDTIGAYRPRLADPRVGFFINGQLSAGRTGFASFDDDSASDARVVYINRWNLQKAEPNAKMSAPVKPITFYLDNSIPAIYREPVRQGILCWNRAFEPLGFKGAVVVKDAPVNDWDTADMRFNTVRWVANSPTAGSASAVALLRENPLTGEVINAGINVSSNWARIGFQQVLEDVRPQGNRHFSQHGAACEMEHEYIEQAREGREIAQAMGLPIDDKKYVADLLRDVIAHEMGHILGLRHNFVASMYLTPAQLKNKSTVQARGTTASVMDYVGYNAFGLKTGAPLFPKEPGKYDLWAIAYGYTPVNAASPNAEKSALNKIAARSNEPGHQYQSDDLADGHDPTIVRYDLSSDPLLYAERSLDVSQELLRTLEKRHPRRGETYATFTRRLRSLIRSNNRGAGLAARYIGGAINRRTVRVAGQKISGDALPFRPVPLAQQRRALGLITRRILAPGSLPIPRRYFTLTQGDPYDFGDPDASAGFPLRDEVSRLRAGALTSLFETDRLNRMANQAWKFPGQTLGFAELFTAARRGVWGELKPKTVLSAEQRDLARTHLRLLINMATDRSPAPADARLVAFSELQTLKKSLAAPRQTSPDSFTRLFLADTLRRVNAALVKKPE